MEYKTNPQHPKKWNDMVNHSRMILRRESGLSFRDMDEAEDFRVFIHAEDFRYPALVVNGDYNFAMRFNPSTFEFEKPSCICGSRSDFGCCCNIPN